jgi:hypothetical protein
VRFPNTTREQIRSASELATRKMSPTSIDFVFRGIFSSHANY